MKRTLIGILIVLGLSAALWASDGDSYGDLDIFDLILGIIENPDPIPQCHWIPLTAEPDSPDTRQTGYRDDGRPMFGFDRHTQKALLTWAYDAGGDHDIALSEWHKKDWRRRIKFVTSSTADEVDPRIHVDANNDLYLTWWENDPGSRVMAVKRSGNSWGMPVQVGTGRRPSVAVWEGGLVVAYERDRARGRGQEIVFAHHSLDTIGSFIPPTVVAATTRTGPLDPIIHVRDGLMWIDWKNGDESIAVSVYQGDAWHIRTTMAWTDPSWVGELTVRHSIELGLTGE